VFVSKTDDAPNDRKPIHLLCDEWEVFANLNSRDAGGNGVELAADSVGGFGLEIERVLVRHPAGEVDDDHAAVSGSTGVAFRLQQLREG
jgi:hypothetical protein